MHHLKILTSKLEYFPPSENYFRVLSISFPIETKWLTIVIYFSHIFFNFFMLDITHVMSSETVTHHGGCHCGRVRWTVDASRSVVAWDCNCSDCSMRGNTHFIVPSSKFKLLGDSERFITTYTFGTHTAKHTFCRVCGITSFYIPRSNPDGVAVTFRCVDPGTLSHVEIRHFDGRNWESSFDQTSIALFSKADGEGDRNSPGFAGK